MPRKVGVKYQNDRHKGNSLCWDCAKACGGCSWSARLKPVRGWQTEPRGKGNDVVYCPKFSPDAKDAGMKWIGRK